MTERRKVEQLTLDAALPERVTRVCEQFETALRQGAAPRLDAYLSRVEEHERPVLQRELQRIQRDYQLSSGAQGTAMGMTSDDNTFSEIPAVGASDQTLPPPSRNVKVTHVPIGGQTIDQEPVAAVSASEQTLSPEEAAALSTDGDTVGFGVAPAVTVGGAGVAQPTMPGYEILGELGRGGMGVVYKARQLGLNRLVALKMVLAGAHAGEEQLARFRLEAEAVAHFQHPNVVQIYDIGQHQGLPYFSLEFVDGGSLSDKIDNKPQTPLEAAAMITVLAQAMAYAHQNGIIHRDLKPVNVLLTRDGQPKIADFGLAKRLEGDSTHTRSGSIMGTPSYMAPEQARGDTKLAGPSVDIYALGAILYEMLTGHPPFVGATVLDTIEQVRTQEPVPPRTLQPNVPEDIETICLKCLQKETHKRYESMEALADDLTRFLKGEPIKARPIGNLERLWRWTKRNPRIAALSGTILILLIAGIVGSTTAAFTINRSRAAAVKARDEADLNAQAAEKARDEATRSAQAAEKARDEASRNAQLAERQANLAMGVLQDLISKVQDKLEDVPGNQELRKEILDIALKGMDEARKLNDAHPQAEASRAAAYERMGRIYKQIGKSEEAMAQFQKVYEIVEQRFQQKPENVNRKHNLAFVLRLLAEMSMDLRRDMAATLDYYKRALKLQEEIVQRPKDVEGSIEPTVAQAQLAETHVRLGATYYRLGEPAQALPHFRDALAIREKLVVPLSEKPTREEQIRRYNALQDLSRTWIAIGDTSFRLKDRTAAEDYYGKAVDLREQLLKEQPKAPFFKQQLGQVLGMRGEFWLRIGQFGKARADLDRAVTLSQEVAKVDANQVDYQRDLALALYRRAEVALEQKDASQAESDFRRCREIREELARKDPKNVRRRMELMMVLAHCGEFARAAELAQTVQKDTAKDDNELLLDVARTYAQCAVAAGADAGLRRDYLNRAVEAVQTAVQHGFKDVVELETQPDLTPLRSEAVFQKILAQLGKRA